MARTQRPVTVQAYMAGEAHRQQQPCRAAGNHAAPEENLNGHPML